VGQLHIPLAAHIDTEQGRLVLDSVRADSAALNPKSSEPYSELVLLLAAQHIIQQDKGENPTLRLLTNKEYPTAVKALGWLQGNSRSPNHWAHSFFHSEGVRSGPFVVDGLGVKYEPGKSQITFAIKLGERTLSGYDLQALLSLLRLLLLGPPANREALRFAGLRQNLNYTIDFFDQPPDGVLTDDPIRSEYHYYTARMQFHRISLTPMDKDFAIGLVDAKLMRELGTAIARSAAEGVIYREVYGSDSVGRTVETLMNQACDAPQAKKVELLKKVCPYEARIAGDLATLNEVNRTRWGYVLRFALPEPARNKLCLEFDLTLAGLQHRSLFQFPMFLSEPTWRATLRFTFSRANLSNVGYFVGFRIGPASSAPYESVLDRENAIFYFSRQDNECLLPGEGAVLFWTPTAPHLPPLQTREVDDSSRRKARRKP
jgi:hypothetical protein